MARDINAHRQPGAEKELVVGVPDAVVLPEVAADLPQEELEKLVRGIRARQVAAKLPNDVPGRGARR